MRKRWDALGELEQKMCKHAFGIAVTAIGLGALCVGVGVVKRKRGDK